MFLWRHHGAEEGPGQKEVQGRAQGALMGKLLLVALAIGLVGLIALAVFVIQL
jgi:hypothetical protein